MARHLPQESEGTPGHFYRLRLAHFGVPLVAWPGAAPPEPIGVLLPKLATPLANGFVRHGDAPDKEQLFHIAVAAAEPIVEPDAMTNDFGGKAVVLVSVGGGGRDHAWLPLCLTKWLSLEAASLARLCHTERWLDRMVNKLTTPADGLSTGVREDWSVEPLRCAQRSTKRVR